MLEFLDRFITASDYVPHGYCIGWWTPLVSVFVVADLLIFFSYFSMPVGLLYFAKRRQDFPYKWLLWMYAAFILSCGSTHLMDVVVLWRPFYGVDALLKALTALVSVATAFAMWPLLPHALRLPSPHQLRQSNLALEAEITERKRAEAALKEAKEAAEAGLIEERILMASIVESSEDAIIAESLSGIVTSWNQGATRMLGYSAEEMMGRSLLETVVAELRSEEEGILSTIASGGSIKHVESTRVRKDGIRIAVSVSVSPVRNKAGEIVGAAKILRDITERKAAEAKIVELNSSLEIRIRERTSELRAANEELEAFAYAVSHDLRAPLRGMLSFSNILADEHAENLVPDARECVEHITRASRNMGQLIDGLLTLSRVTRGALQREPVNLSDMAERLREELQRAEPQRSVAWDIEPNLTVHGDGRLLESVMRNLIGNSWKYTAKCVAPRITVAARADGSSRGVCVSDNGAGFDMAFAEQLFQPFRRLHRQDEFPGLGIGLATVLRIIHRHGGSIQASGEPDRGASFWFTLPVPETGGIS